MLYVAAAAISAATFAGVANLPALIAAFFIFEVCVGMYFPSIGTFFPGLYVFNIYLLILYQFTFVYLCRRVLFNICKCICYECKISVNF